MFSLFKLLPFLALAGNTFAAPVQPTEAVTSAPNIWINGEQITSAEASAQSIGLDCAGLDIRDCAKGASAYWSKPADSSASQIAFIQGKGSYLSLDYTLHLTECDQSVPLVTYHGPAYPCNFKGGCPVKLSSVVTTTDSRRLGYKVGVSVEGSVGFKVEAVASASVKVTVSAEHSADWTDTTSKSDTIERTYNLQNGDTCAPTVVNFQSKCNSKISINKFRWLDGQGGIMYPDLLGNVDNICTVWQQDPQWLLCGNNGCSGNFDDQFSDKFDLISKLCQGEMVSAPEALMVSNYASEYTLEGCAFS